QLLEKAAISKSDADRLAKNYDLLRRIEMALRRFENKNVSILPAAAEQEKLAARLGYKKVELFTKEYRAARETIRSLYERYIKKQIA
ncbi:MAG TPA: hypothetical protein VIU85_05320, partial [Chthoniobacterales bacterium]